MLSWITTVKTVPKGEDPGLWIKKRFLSLLDLPGGLRWKNVVPFLRNVYGIGAEEVIRLSFREEKDSLVKSPSKESRKYWRRIYDRDVCNSPGGWNVLKWYAFQVRMLGEDSADKVFDGMFRVPSAMPTLAEVNKNDSESDAALKNTCNSIMREKYGLE